MTIHSLRPPAHDVTADLLVLRALRENRHVLLRRMERDADDRIDLINYLDEAAALLERLALMIRSLPVQSGAHAMLARPDGTVELALPSGTTRIRRPRFRDAE